MRTEKCTASRSWAKPVEPSTVPAVTYVPVATAIVERYDTDVFRLPPWSTVIDNRPATEPANVTQPAPAALTGLPWGDARSIPQWPA